MNIKTTKDKEQELLSRYSDELGRIEETVETDMSDVSEQVLIDPLEDEDLLESDIDVETDDLSVDMIEDDEGYIIIDDSESKSLSGEKYTLTKIELCNRFFMEPECEAKCPLNVNGDCLHATIKSPSDYKECEKRLLEWISENNKTNGHMMLQVLLEAGIPFEISYLNKDGKAWFDSEYKE